MKRRELPETCFSTLPGTGELIILKSGETGYYHSEWNTGDPVKNQEIADFHNRKSGITPAQVQAMVIGSLCGFDAPGAKPQMYLDEAKLLNSVQVNGTIKDPIISLFTPVEGELREYSVAGKTVSYFELSAMPEPIMSRWANDTVIPDLVAGMPMVPVSVTWNQNGHCSMSIEAGGVTRGQEKNAGFNIIAKVEVGAVEYVLGERRTAPSPFVTWERTPGNDEPGKPNYYWGHYFDSKSSATRDFCHRAMEKYQMLAEYRKPSIRQQLAAKPIQRDTPAAHNRDKEAR